jgi:hypothetical protein
MFIQSFLRKSFSGAGGASVRMVSAGTTEGARKAARLRSGDSYLCDQLVRV